MRSVLLLGSLLVLAACGGGDPLGGQSRQHFAQSRRQFVRRTLRRQKVLWGHTQPFGFG